MILPVIPSFFEHAWALVSHALEFLNMVAAAFFFSTMVALLLSQVIKGRTIALQVWTKVFARHGRKIGTIWAIYIFLELFSLVTNLGKDFPMALLAGLAMPVISIVSPSVFARRLAGQPFTSVLRRHVEVVVAIHVMIGFLALIEIRYNIPVHFHVVLAWNTWIACALILVDTIIARPFTTRIIHDQIVKSTYLLRSEYLIILELATVHVPAMRGAIEHPGLWRKMDEREQGFIDFFTSKWYFVAERSQLLVGLRVVIEDGKFKTYLTLVSRSVFRRDEKAIRGIASAVERIRASVKNELGMDLVIVAGRALNDAARIFLPPRLSRVGIRETMHGIRKISWPGKGKYPMYVRAMKVHFNLYINSFISQKYLKRHVMNAIIEGALHHGVSLQYFFNLDCNRTKIGKSETREIDRFYEIEHDGTYTRNFDYDLRDTRFGAGFIVFAPTPEDLKRACNAVVGVLDGTLESDFQDIALPWQIITAMKPVMTNFISNRLRTHLFFKFCQFPTKISPEQERVITIDVESPSITACKAGTLTIGKVIVNGKPMQDFLVRREDLKKHVFISGMTGTGKSTFVRHFIKEWIPTFSDVPFLLIEIKGEYTSIPRECDGVKLVRPGVDFFFNAFGDGTNPRAHAEKLYDILETSFNLEKYKDFSPQMEKILVEVLHATAARQDPSERTFQTFIKLAKQYIADNKATIPFIESSWIGIENRLRKLTTGPLQVIFNTPHVETPFEELYNSNIIVSMGELVKGGASKDDMYFVSNMLLKYLFDMNIAGGASNSIKHLTIIEDAQYFDRKHLDGTRGRSSYFEDFGLLLRGTGEMFMSISTRPSLSVDILANAGMIVAFQTKLKEDIERLQSLLHLQAPELALLEVLPEFTCVVKVNSIPRPFLLEVAGIPPTAVAPVDCTRDPMGNVHGNEVEDERQRIETISAMIRHLHEMEKKLWNIYRESPHRDTEHLRLLIEQKRKDIGNFMACNDIKGRKIDQIKRIAKACHVTRQAILDLLEPA